MNKLFGLLLLCLIPGLVGWSFISEVPAPSGGGDECDGFLVCQNFEGVGYDNSEVWVESVEEGETSTRYADEDYSISPLLGGQSLELRSDSYQKVSVSTVLTSASQTISAKVMFRLDSGDPANHVDFVILKDSSDNTLAVVNINSSSLFRVTQTGGTTGYGTVPITQSTVYYLWIDHIASTGTDGTTEIFVSTNDTKPGTATLTSSNGTATNSVAAIEFAARHTTIIIVDNITVAS